MSIKCENEWLRENSEEEMKKGDKYDHILSIRKIDLIVINIDQCYKKEKNTLRVGNVNVVLKKGDEEIEQKEEDPESLCYFDRGNGQIESIDLESSEEEEISEEEDHDDIVPTFLLHPNEIDENDTYPAFDPPTEHTQEEASQSSFPLLPFHSLLDSILNRSFSNLLEHIQTLNRQDVLQHLNSFVNNPFLYSFSYYPLTEETTINKVFEMKFFEK